MLEILTILLSLAICESQNDNEMRRPFRPSEHGLKRGINMNAEQLDDLVPLSPMVLIATTMESNYIDYGPAVIRSI